MHELVKRAFFLTARSKAFSRFLRLLEQVDDRRPNLLRVLAYHRIDRLDARPDLSRTLISATPDEFDQQMEFLAAKYHVVSMQEVRDAFARCAPLPPRAVLLTFDDAYQDFAEHAWPILKRYRLPATLFVPTAFPDDPEQTFWWDRLYQAVSSTDRRVLETSCGRIPLATVRQRRAAFVRLGTQVVSLPHCEAMPWVEEICNQLDAPASQSGVLSWAALRGLASEGVTLGAHTRTHPLLNRVSPKEAEAEAAGSLRDLQREIGPICPVLAYPNGSFSGEVVQVVERAGFELAFTMARGLVDVRTADRLRLHRLYVGPRTTLPVLRAQLLQWSVYLNQSVA
jgi:peptidoglycan/xylan/chitin deacetylase (PgdA/CDA1 family)